MQEDKDKNGYNQVVTDMELERYGHPIGQLVHISTVTHAWRGVLEAVTPSYYILSKEHPIALVDSTGPMGDYLNKPTNVREGDMSKKPKGQTLINRGAVSWLIAFGDP